MWGTVEWPKCTVTWPGPGAHSLATSPCPQEGVTSQTSHWSRLYFMTFYIVTMVGPWPRSLPFNTQSLQPPLPGGRPPRDEGPGLGSASDRARPGAGPAAAHAPLPALCARPGGDDHHRRLHPRGLRLPHELQPQEPGLGRSVRAAVARAFPLLICLAARPSGCPVLLSGCPAVQASGSSACLSGLSVTSLMCIDFQILVF